MVSVTDVRAELARLIAFPTVSRDSNLQLIAYVQERLKEHGVEARLVHNEDNTKANLLATIGPMVEGGVVLSGHTDVVPIDDQDWKTDPFALAEKDGKLFGRGTCDMKCFIATSIAALPDMVAANLPVPIHFAFSYDEEVGCAGVPSLIKLIRKELPLPRAVIVGEPTDMKVVTAHKGVTAVNAIITGKEAHSSQTQLGYSAVMAAGRLIQCVADMNAENAASANKDPHFEPDHTTMTVNVIQGGTALNIMAGHCNLTWDIRSLPGDDPQSYIDRFETFCEETVLPDMRKTAPHSDIDIQVRAGTPALQFETDSEAERLCRQLTGDNTIRAASYAAEAGQFQEAGLSTVICGPGSIAQAHQPNEFITLDQVELGTRFMTNLIEKLAH
ncbi:MAG: acetylornithine deacetylase [Rhodospirillaceae bacterium]|jgi:acetylornithine deacetylase|nr:acetylornithine deacetylase [Rhodospirillaceae bacterium]MBT5566261.1 acetylornithine deacetylase [Rhodospirillaceae bacterium]MBT6089042.1 acetylornithine deacetylase [Rhodospirillaceae bacterium]MBT7450452.1 acetylornithine deacetylase [Rhodospirillaceae bacterium]